MDHLSQPFMLNLVFFCAIVFHLLIMCWTVSSLSPHKTYPCYSSVYYYYYYYCFTLCEFFTPMLAGGLSHEFEWQNVSSGLQDSSQYSNHSQQCSSLNCLDSSSDFKLFQSPSQLFGIRSKCTYFSWYHCHSNVSHIF